MKKFILSFSCFIFFLSFYAQAQIKWQVQAGPAFSNWRGDGLQAINDIVDVTGGMVNRQSLTGFYAGVSTELPLGGKISFAPALQYTQTGTSLRGDLDIKILNFLGIGARADLVQKSIELPLMVKAEVAPGFKVMAGPSANYMFDSDLKVRASILGINLLQEKIDMTNYFEPLQLSAAAGVEYSTGTGIGIQAIYHHGITRIAKEASANVYTQSLRVGLSYAF